MILIPMSNTCAKYKWDGTLVTIANPDDKANKPLPTMALIIPNTASDMDIPVVVPDVTDSLLLLVVVVDMCGISW